MMFSLLSYLVAIPSAIKVFSWAGTLYKGAIFFSTPTLYALGFTGLEWQTASPPIKDNFERTPIVMQPPYEYNPEDPDSFKSQREDNV